MIGAERETNAPRLASLIVRVKRHRTEAPSSTLCILQDNDASGKRFSYSANGLTRDLQNLTYTDSTPSKYVVLTHTNTVNSIDSSSLEQSQNSQVHHNYTETPKIDSNVLFVPKRKCLKTFHDSSTPSRKQDYFVLDLNQVPMHSANPAISCRTPILNPADRQMSRAISIALQTGDFNGNNKFII
jgi:hypothetical protein